MFILKSQKRGCPNPKSATEVTSVKSEILTSSHVTAAGAADHQQHPDINVQTDMINTQVIPEILTITHDHR